MKWIIFSLLVIFSTNLYAQKIAEKVIHVAHSHNDYNKRKPLINSLKYGFMSMEIDVFSHKNDLKLAHVGLFLNIRKTIEEIYFEPLAKILEERTWIYSNYEEPLELMIDFKTNPTETLPLLLKAIEPYKQYFTFYNDNTLHKRPLKLVISGNGFRYNQVENLDSIFVFLDGSVKNCEQNFPDKLLARGSANYKSHFTWKGKKEMPREYLEKLKEYIKNNKDCDKKIRFYRMKHRKAIWHIFLDEGVGWINIDKKKKFANFYHNEYIPN